MSNGGLNLTQNYHLVPNEITEALMTTHLSGNAAQVYQCIVRFTLGYNRTSHSLAASFISAKTGVHARNVRRCLADLENLGLVYLTHSSGEANTVTLNLHPRAKLPDGAISPDGEIAQGGVANLPSGGGQNCARHIGQFCPTEKDKENTFKKQKKNSFFSPDLEGLGKMYPDDF